MSLTKVHNRMISGAMVSLGDFGSDADFFSAYTDITSKATAEVTANDVTDAISMLAVAETAV